MSKSNAWLLELAEGWQVAVAEYEMIEYVMSPTLLSVPLTPAYANSVLKWQGRMLANIDFRAIMGQHADSTANACVLAYQNKPGEALGYVSVALKTAPVRIVVDDDQACQPAEGAREVWPYLADCWFEYMGKPVPVLNVKRLETVEFGEKAKEHLKLNIVEYLKTGNA